MTNPSSSVPASGKAIVLYDGQCPLCLKGIALLKRLDWLGRLTFRNARDRKHLPAHEPPLDPERLLEEMHLLTPEGYQLLHGFTALRWMAWRLPLLWPLAPFLYLPGIPPLGQRLYLWVARHRFHLVPCHGGICTLPRHPQ
ncbi:MAG: DUF393 domain-containing protein [Planctomycetes bacterium]|nr:DUF393 domain-containing protein [Planctomycetota bacterium]